MALSAEEKRERKRLQREEKKRKKLLKKQKDSQRSAMHLTQSKTSTRRPQRIALGVGWAAVVTANLFGIVASPDASAYNAANSAPNSRCSSRNGRDFDARTPTGRSHTSASRSPSPAGSSSSAWAWTSVLLVTAARLENQCPLSGSKKIVKTHKKHSVQNSNRFQCFQSAYWRFEQEKSRQC